MTDMIDVETGEIVKVGRDPKMHPEIAAAIIKVMKGVKQLGTDERNQHGNYNYVSTDKFMGLMRPLLADADLLIVSDEAEVDIRESPKYDQSGKQIGSTSWLFAEFDVYIYHATGICCGPFRRRTMVIASGAQAFGSAQSYVLKYFMRNLFQIPTGDKDADADPAEQLPTGKAKAQPQPKPNTAADAKKADAKPPGWMEEAANGKGNGEAKGDPLRPVEPEVDREALQKLYTGLCAQINDATDATHLNEIRLYRKDDFEKIKVAFPTSYKKLVDRAEAKLASFPPPESNAGLEELGGEPPI